MERCYYNINPETLDVLAPDWQADNQYMEIVRTGDYAADFYADGTKFTTFPFSVKSKVVTSGDTYYFIDGAWSKWACLSYDNGDPESTIKFNISLRNEDSESKDQDFRVKIFNTNGGSLFCMGFTTNITLRADWYFLDDSLEFPPKSGDSYGEYVHAKDGNYAAKVFLGGQRYGEYDFSVSGGKFSHSGRTVRDQGDPTTYIEGGNDCFWYERK